ncbi:MAG: NAD(P)-dependent oxidoreductase [Chloroflexota bacterium]
MTTNILPVHFEHPLSADERTHLIAALEPDVAVTEGPALPDPAVYRVLVAGRPSRAALEASPYLERVIIPWAGLPEETRLIMPDFPHISIHNLHHNAAPVAELTLMLLLAAAKFTLRYDAALRSGDWRIRYDRPGPSVLLEGRTALILGYGAIGRRVARACRTLGMRVLATRRQVEQPYVEEDAAIYPASALPVLLPQANALIICLPLTPETDGLIGPAELALLPPKAVLVNIGRGRIVDEKALYEALQTGRLHAAGIDVWYSYPPDESSRAHHRPSAYPFHELDNIVMSPHRGGAADETARLRMTALAELLNAAAHGKPIPNRVDLNVGY